MQTWQYLLIFNSIFGLVFLALFLVADRDNEPDSIDQLASKIILCFFMGLFGLPILAFFFYSMCRDSRGPRPATHLVLTPGEDGYWICAHDRVIPFGAAHSSTLSGAVSIRRPEEDDPHIWVTPGGRVFVAGGQGTFGDLLGTELQAPICFGLLTSTGNGYWLVGQDGAVFPFGDARFYGSLSHAPADYGIWWKSGSRPQASTDAPENGMLMYVQVQKEPVEAEAKPEDAASSTPA